MVELGDWALSGECRTAPQEWFFPERENDTNITKAKAVCGKCPVREPCLKEALLDPSIEGIWGGTTKQERSRIRAFQWLQLAEELRETSSG